MTTSKFDGQRWFRNEWSRRLAGPSWKSFAALRAIPIKCILDVGCGAGQELVPFLESGTAFGVGLDPMAEAGIIGRELFASNFPRARIEFVRGQAETLPFAPETFDAVICRLVLMYTNNAKAIGEISRVLRTGGVLILRVHNFYYYLLLLRTGLLSVDLKTMASASRALLGGSFFLLTGRQPRAHLFSEIFHTERTLKTLLERYGLVIECEMPESKRNSRSYLIRKKW